MEDARVLAAPREWPPLPPDVTGDLPRYRAWLADRQRLRRSAQASPATGGPPLTALLVVDRPDARRLEVCLGSLAGQTHRDWRLCLIEVGTPGLRARVVRWAGVVRLGRRRTRLLHLPAGTGAGAALRAGASIATTPALAVLGQHDRLAPDALALLGAGLADADVAYGDDDTDGPGGTDDGVTGPRLKGDWSPELALGWNYLGLPLGLRRAALEAAGGFGDSDGTDALHDAVLRITERAGRVHHVAEVLSHVDPRPAGAVAPGTPDGAGAGAVVGALVRRGEGGVVTAGPLRGSWLVRRPVPGGLTASVIVPFRDSTRFLRACADSLAATAGGVRLELILVDNGSTSPETLTLVDRLSRRPSTEVVLDPRPFNWAALNNAAALRATGDVLLFVNDDVETRTPGWLESLVAAAMRPDVGAAGARLLYPDGRLQHAGIVVGLGGAAGHVLAGLAPGSPGYLGMAALARDVSAVTGACLATRRSVFEELDGFDESLGVDLNDVDYCLRLRRAGLRVVYEPAAELIHHESPTRGTSGSMGDISRFLDRWSGLYEEGDPFLSPHLSRTAVSAGLADPDEAARRARWLADLDRT